MEIANIRQYLLETFSGTAVVEDEGNYFFFFDKENRIPYVTIVSNDKYDRYSDLDREGIYRLNIGIGKERYRSMFPVDRFPTVGGYDFTAQNVVMPHPEYGRVYWICVLNPSKTTFEELGPILNEAYEIAVNKYNAAEAAKNKAAVR
jgi:hypothetical protein